MVNKENMRKLIEILEAPVQRAPVFNMAMWGVETRDGYECGTAACIAGFAYWLKNGKFNRDSDVSLEARTWLGLNFEQSSQLFTPRSFEWNHLGVKPYETTAAEAARVVRHLYNTGEVDWLAAKRLVEVIEDPQETKPKNFWQRLWS